MPFEIRKVPYKNWFDVPESDLEADVESPFLGVTGAGKTVDIESIERQVKTECYNILVDNENAPSA